MSEKEKWVMELLSVSKEACHYMAEQKTMLAKDIAYDLSKAISRLEKCIKTETTARS